MGSLIPAYKLLQASRTGSPERLYAQIDRAVSQNTQFKLTNLSWDLVENKVLALVQKQLYLATTAACLPLRKQKS